MSPSLELVIVGEEFLSKKLSSFHQAEGATGTLWKFVVGRPSAHVPRQGIIVDLSLS